MKKNEGKRRKKSVLLRSLIINDNRRNKTANKTLENPNPTFQSKENNIDTKEHVSSMKDDVIDFCADDTAIKNDTTEKKQSHF